MYIRFNPFIMSAVVNFKTDPKIKIAAQKLAEKIGLNLSDILNIYLRDFVRNKEINIKVHNHELEPSDELIQMIEKGEKEIKGGKAKRFNNMDDAIIHLAKL